jgi:hypothetical protein
MNQKHDTERQNRNVKYTEWLFLHDANKYVKSGECGGDVNHKINSAESLLSILRL